MMGFGKKEAFLGLMTVAVVGGGVWIYQNTSSHSTSKVEKTVIDETKTTVTQVSTVDKSLYDSTIEAYKTVLATGEINQSLNTLTSLYYEAYETSTGYAFYDFDDNGVEELVFAFQPSKVYSIPTIIDIYTITNKNEVKRLTNTDNQLDMIGERMKLTPLKDHTFAFHGSSGAYDSSDYGYAFNKAGDALEKTETVSSSEILDLSTWSWTDLSQTKTDETAEGNFTVTVDVLNVRDQASKSGNIVGTLNSGSVVSYDQKETKDGYIWVSYIDTNSNQRRYLAIGTEAGESYGTLATDSVVTKNSSQTLSQLAIGESMGFPQELVGIWESQEANGSSSANRITVNSDGSFTSEFSAVAFTESGTITSIRKVADDTYQFEGGSYAYFGIQGVGGTGPNYVDGGGFVLRDGKLYPQYWQGAGSLDYSKSLFNVAYTKQ